jgi:phosphatidate cytidylyltransferase
MPPDQAAPLLQPPWDDPAFTPIAIALLIAAIASGGALLVVTRAGRGGATPETLWARWRTWLVIATVFTTAVFSGPIAVAALVLIASLQGLREWAALLDLPTPHRVALGLDATLIIGLSLLGPGAMLAAIPLLLLAGMLQPVLGADVRRGMRDLAFSALGFAYLPLLLGFAVLLETDRTDGAVLLFATGAAAAASDIGAYVAGKTFGRHRLAPTLSPNKTVEGLAGNLAGAALVITLLTPLLPLGWPALAAMAVVVAGAAAWGDLFKSALKREVGVKDAGTLLPGFGGILDRIDSTIVAIPLVYYLTGIVT